MSNPINEKLYQGRREFSIVALTGVLGSGFEDLTKLMKDKEELLHNVRDPRFLASPSRELMYMEDIDDSKAEREGSFPSSLSLYPSYLLAKIPKS